MAEERAGRKGKRYVGVDLPVEDYLALERLAQQDDSSIGRLVRMGVKMLLHHQRKWDSLGPTPEAPAVTAQALKNVSERLRGADKTVYIGKVAKTTDTSWDDETRKFAGEPPEPEEDK
jgi:hypothetical protein